MLNENLLQEQSEKQIPFHLNNIKKAPILQVCKLLRDRLQVIQTKMQGYSNSLSGEITNQNLVLILIRFCKNIKFVRSSIPSPSLTSSPFCKISQLLESSCSSFHVSSNFCKNKIFCFALCEFVLIGIIE